jgi:hypothetical protein
LRPWRIGTQIISAPVSGNLSLADIQHCHQCADCSSSKNISPENYLEYAGDALFARAVLLTFSTKCFEHLAHTSQKHAGLWHLLAEVKVVSAFGRRFW